MPDTLSFVLGAIVLSAIGGFAAAGLAALCGIPFPVLTWPAGAILFGLVLAIGTGSGVAFGRVLERRERRLAADRAALGTRGARIN